MKQLTEVQWTAEYKTGISIIDTQHENLFALYNEMVNHYNSQNVSTLNSTIDTLIKYIQQHFSYEESLMEKYEYAGIADHMEKHSSFIEHVMELAIGNADQQINEHFFDFAKFLEDWLTNHIMVVDRGYIDTIPVNV